MIKVSIPVNCKICGTKHILNVPYEGHRLWRSGVHIQNALPTLSPDERELLISGTCGTCWDKMFPADPEEDSDV